jgi:TonB-dependent SusC/RagA subfamily outer membrane receptor
MLALVAACHQKSSVAEAPTPADSVLVGYGQQSREQAGGAVQSATGEQLGNEKRSRVEELLEGRFPGVEVVRTPSGGLSIRIRGGSTILGNKGPLYVIDGIPVEVDPEHGLDWLNPTDIERIDVLKDAAETSMYGVRGTNGVILITTKRNR